MERIPQTLLAPAPMLTYPLLPQDAPHEFLTMKYGPAVASVPYPTARTPWSRLVPHPLVMTPEWYIWKASWSASMATETGARAMAAVSWAGLFGVTSVNALTRPYPLVETYLQVPSMAVYG